MLGLMMDYPLTLEGILEHSRQLYHHKEVVTKLPDGSFHRYTYGDMYKRIRRMSSAMVSLGLELGDRVGTFAWNNYQHLELYFAIPLSGGVCHTLNIRLSEEQLAYIVNHAEDKIVFVDGTLLPLFHKVADQLNTVKHFVLFNCDRSVETTLPNVLFYEDLIERGEEDFSWRVHNENQAMGLCYTSGTTGNPKGALYSHRSMYLHTMGSNQASALAISERDVVLPVVPQFHAMAWGLPYSCAMAGANLVMPGPHLQAQPLAEMIEKERVTVAAGVPTIWNGLYQELKQNPRDISCVRSLVVGGSAMPRALTAGYEKDLAVNVTHAWGMTELSPLGTVCNLLSSHDALDEEARWNIKSRQGYPVPGVEMRIVDDEGKNLPWDGQAVGEVQVRGPWVVKSYFKREPTVENFTEDGWFRTGDVAAMEPSGFMRITDRTKDLVKSGGEWISSVELENLIMSHDQVLEAAVIAIPDSRWTERPLAAVVRNEGSDLSADDLRSFLEDKVAKFWIPEEVRFIDAVPKTSVGKFDKKVLRAQHADGKL